MSADHIVDVVMGKPKQPVRPAWDDRTETPGENNKNLKPACLAYLDAIALNALALVAGFGARKYKPFGYLKGVKQTDLLNALHRHVNAYMCGEELDEESGLPHLAHAAWHCLALISAKERNRLDEDLPG